MRVLSDARARRLLLVFYLFPRDHGESRYHHCSVDGDGFDSEAIEEYQIAMTTSTEGPSMQAATEW